MTVLRKSIALETGLLDPSTVVFLEPKKQMKRRRLGHNVDSVNSVNSVDSGVAGNTRDRLIGIDEGRARARESSHYHLQDSFLTIKYTVAFILGEGNAYTAAGTANIQHYTTLFTVGDS